MKIDGTTSLPDVAREVCTALDEIGVTVVLTGGSAATYYAPGAYQSNDIDYVVVEFQAGNTEQAERRLADLGFRRQRDHYSHDTSPYPIEFPPGPLAVGRELLTHWRTERRSRTVLYVLTPTDCCKDRLAAFIHWNDRSGLEQAIAVAQAVRDEIEFADLAAWADAEGGSENYTEFRQRIGSSP